LTDFYTSRFICVEFRHAFADDETLAFDLKKPWNYFPKHKRKWGNMATADSFIYTYNRYS